MIAFVKKNEWFRVYFADELPLCPVCWDEPLCLECDDGTHWGECDCLGPDQVIDNDEYECEYRGTQLWARKKW